jgi:hypothetical protein
MISSLDIDLNFPIKDEASAWLMCLKARHLCEAGILNADEKNVVLTRAATVVAAAGRRCGGPS